MWFQRRMATLAIFIISLSIGQHAWADVAVLQGTRSLSIEYADQAAWAALKDCRKRGYSVAVAVVAQKFRLTFRPGNYLKMWIVVRDI